MGFRKLNSEKNVPASQVLILNEFYTLEKYTWTSITKLITIKAVKLKYEKIGIKPATAICIFLQHLKSNITDTSIFNSKEWNSGFEFSIHLKYIPALELNILNSCRLTIHYNRNNTNEVGTLVSRITISFKAESLKVYYISNIPFASFSCSYLDFETVP